MLLGGAEQSPAGHRAPRSHPAHDAADTEQPQQFLTAGYKRSHSHRNAHLTPPALGWHCHSWTAELCNTRAKQHLASQEECHKLPQLWNKGVCGFLIFLILVMCYNSPLVLRKRKGKATAANEVAAMLLWTIITASNMLMRGYRFWQNIHRDQWKPNLAHSRNILPGKIAQNWDL